MKQPEQLGPRGQKSIFLQVLILFLVLLAPLASRAQNGNGMYDAIQIGMLSEYDFYADSRNNGYYNGTYYYDNYYPGYYSNAQPSPDVWYSFTVNSTVDLDLSLCWSQLDAYVHLLNQYGDEVANNSMTECRIEYMGLPSGTYYVVVEGKGYATNYYELAMSVYPSYQVPSPGANMGNAVDAGTLVPGVPFSDTRSNADPLLGDDIGHSSYDIYYKFTLNSTSEVALSHCGSAIDTYMHLLSSSGAPLLANDDNTSPGSPCPGTRSYIQTTLPAGTYYVVSEGYSNYSGSITTTISLVPPAPQPPVISYSSPATLQVGTAASLLPTNTGGPVQASGGTVSTFAGSGSVGSADGTGTSASFNMPTGGAFDSQGNLYVPDILNHRIRKITPSGVVTTFAGSGAAGSANGTGTAASFNKPFRLVRDAAGNFYVTDRESNKIRKITPSGVVSTLAGSGAKSFANGTGAAAAFSAPAGIAVDGSGNVYVADQGNQRIRKITPSGVVSTLAGSGVQGSANGTGTSASFSYPLGMSMDASGNLYVADYSSQKIRKVTLSGVVTTFAGSGTGGSADGPAASATFTNPAGTAVDAQGNVYVADINRKIRKVSGGMVSTVAGTGLAGSADGPYLSASFRTPHSMMFDAQGNLFVGDSDNHKIRRLGTGPAYSISPALPAGVVFNDQTGEISGTPVAVSAAQNYTVTAVNSAGSGTFVISIRVLAGAPVASSDRNYIVTYSPRGPIADASGLPLKSASEVQQTVQYFDGLGRPMQTVQTKGSPDGIKDLVQPIAYDAFGREAKKYLPYATGVGGNSTYRADALTAQASFYNAPPTGVVHIPVVSGVTPSYGETLFEASPLNRAIEQGAPGVAWQLGRSMLNGSGHTVRTEWTTNNEIDFGTIWQTRKAALYGVSLSAEGVPALTLNDAYAAGQLYVTVTEDENWTVSDGRNGIVEEFKDKQGRVVLKRAFNLNNGTHEMLSTYYVYDDFGNLTFVLPPGIDPDRSVPPTNSELDNFAYSYRYDGRNRMVEKKLPGKGWEYMVYNKLDQVVAAQDTNQRAAHEWLVTKYDGLGRVVQTGIWNNGNVSIGRTVLQGLVNGQTGSNLWEERSYEVTGTDYSNRSWPTSNLDLLSVNYYDDYGVSGIPNNQSAGYSKMVHGLQTASKVKVLGTNTYLWTVSYYDNHGRVVREYSQHYKGGTVSNANFDDISNEYSFTGLLEKSTRKHHAGNTGVAAVTVITEQTYDHWDRPIDTWTTVNSGIRTLVARNGYNEIGQQINKKLGSKDSGTTFGQIVSYAYNERRWTKEIVSPLFSQYLKYNEGTNPQYNGNISQQEFTRYNLTQPTPSLVSDTYSYTYDHLDRLTEGSMIGGKGRETLTYDKMGNIQSLIRTGTGSSIVDQLSYSYIGNRLMNVTDAISEADPNFPYHYGGTTGYTYDAGGNMKTRVNATNTGNNITGITYNYLNLPSSVIAAGGSVSYVYDATGRKLRSTNGIQGQTRDYIDGIEYVDGSIELIHHSEGRILNTGSSYVFEYYLKDHLGNNRSGFGEGINVTVPTFSADYYPFGVQYGEFKRPGNPKNNYLYNGKELQDGLKLYDYGARLYDPVIGRWGTVDPLAEQYNNVSGYNYALNNPIKFIDPDGRMVTITGDAARTAFIALRRNMLASSSKENEEENKEKDDPKKESMATKIEAEPKSSNWGATKAAVGASGLLLLDDLTGIGVVDDVAIPFIIIGGIVYDLYNYSRNIQGFGDPKEWTTTYLPPSQNPINNPPQGFDPKKPPAGWKGPVNWTLFGIGSYRLYKNVKESFGTPLPSGNKTIITPSIRK